MVKTKVEEWDEKFLLALEEYPEDLPIEGLYNELVVATLYDRGWRAKDLEKIKEDYGLTQQEAQIISLFLLMFEASR